jgi:hypothetical protein
VGDYLGQSMWSKTAGAPSVAMAAGRPPIGVADKLLSIARIGVATKGILRKGDIPVRIGFR